MFISSPERIRFLNTNRFNSAGYACHCVYKLSTGTWVYGGYNRVLAAAQKNCAKKIKPKNSNIFTDKKSDNSSNSEDQADFDEQTVVLDKQSALAFDRSENIALYLKNYCQQDEFEILKKLQSKSKAAKFWAEQVEKFVSDLKQHKNTVPEGFFSSDEFKKALKVFCRKILKKSEEEEEEELEVEEFVDKN